MILGALLLFDFLFGLRVLQAAVLFWPLLAVAAIELHFQGWVMYAAIMRLKMVRPLLSAPQTTMGKMLLCIGYVLDVMMNLLATLWLLQLPGEWLLSSRLERNVYSGRVSGFRKRWSESFRRLYLDNIDPRGIHRS